MEWIKKIKWQILVGKKIVTRKNRQEKNMSCKDACKDYCYYFKFYLFWAHFEPIYPVLFSYFVIFFISSFRVCKPQVEQA
jgi:hypothetical protein